MERELQTIDTKSYEKLMKGEVGNYFITFRYMLPFRLPAEDGKTIVLDECLFLITQKEYEYYALQDGFGKLPSSHTIIEGTIKLKRHQYRSILRDFNRDMMQQKSLSDAFDDQLAMLNTFMEIINIKFQYLSVHSVHMGEVIGPSVYKVYKVDGDFKLENSSNGLFLIKEPPRLEAERYNSLSSDEIDFMIENFTEFEKHPTRNIALVARKGEKAFDLFDYNAAIVNYNTVFEVILLSFVIDYYVMENIKTEEKAQNLLEAGLKNIKKEHFFPVIDKLNLPDGGIIKHITNIYLETSYLHRNNIVHNGNSYGEKEASEAIERVKDLTYLLNNNMNRVESSPFVDRYIKFNMNSRPDFYELIKSKYK